MKFQANVPEVRIADFTPADYDDVYALWASAGGIVLREADLRPGIECYLARNPSQSFVARGPAGELLGAVLAGHDGRRGYLQHLAVRADARGRGIGRALAMRVRAALLAEGVEKCHLFVVPSNGGALAFWQRLGWRPREDVLFLSATLSDSANA